MEPANTVARVVMGMSKTPAPLATPARHERLLGGDIAGKPANLAVPRDRRLSAIPVGRPGESVRRLGHVAASSGAMHDVMALVERFAPTSITVLLNGETGTGKDVFAHAIHAASVCSIGPFIVFDCGAVPPNLVESELFGHERGAFTGALAEHPGAFERARGGTLFLDEIGELPLELQPRLLRALDSKAFRRVGGTRDRRVEARIVAATNRDLASLVAAKQFRQDLFFRLAGALVNLPPLRDRLEDLPVLVPRLLEDVGRGDTKVPEATLSALAAHTWPGNVRELKNTLACALAFVDGGVLEPRHLRFVAASPENVLDRLPLGGHSLETIERAAIKQTLQQNGGSRVRAAKALGIAPSTLYEKLKKYSF
jgi:transcriptional regulator with PAS, ATPase and Fis domain